MLLMIILIANFAFVTNAITFSPLPGKFVDVSAKGNELWAIDRYQNVYRMTGTSWMIVPLNVTGGGQISGMPSKIAASSDGWVWLITDNGGNIYRLNATTGKWDNIRGALTQITAMGKDLAMGTIKGEIWRLRKDGSFTEQIPFDGHAVWVAMGDGDEIWTVDSRNYLFRWSQTKQNEWMRMPGLEVANVDVQGSGKVVMTTKCGRMYVWVNGSWKMLDKVRGIRATITDTTIYYVDEVENVMKSEGHLSDLASQNGSEL